MNTVSMTALVAAHTALTMATEALMPKIGESYNPAHSAVRLECLYAKSLLGGYLACMTSVEVTGTGSAK